MSSLIRLRPVTRGERKRCLALDREYNHSFYVEYLREAVLRSKRRLAGMGAGTIRNLQSLMPLARQELDAADCAAAAARSTTLPRAMRESAASARGAETRSDVQEAFQ
ncbi:hypothetical protein V491_01469 [Pseudogymnoascus sp. VKM F-3775]|nr:hypothetical protein V491_01469 [Pseudogymnoascus sp. VKM F-3775]